MTLWNDSKGSGRMADLIKERRSIRLFKSDPVSQELLINLLNIAVWAPTHGVREPWRFILYKDEARRGLANAMLKASTQEERGQYTQSKVDYFMNIPYHIVVVQIEDPRQRQWDEDYAAVCCWIQSFQLAAWEEGLGVVWKTNPFIYHPVFREAVNVRGGEKIVGLLHVGYPEQIPAPRPRTDASQLLTIHEE